MPDRAGGERADGASLPEPVAWLDGALVRLDAAHLSIADRGFQLGDGVFETLRARRGVTIERAEHFERLHESAAALAIRLPWSDDALSGAIRELLAAQGLDAIGDGGPAGDAALRITVSRGAVAGRGLVPPGWDLVRATVAIQAWPHLPPSLAALGTGVAAITSRHRRDPASPLVGVKSTSRADYVHARLEAERAGADDAIFLTLDGHISESTTANVFVVSGERLLTPPLKAAILAGTTRAWLLARGAGGGDGQLLGGRLRVETAELRPDDLFGADEAFLCSSVAGVIPLTRVDGRPIGDGAPGPITLALREARERWIDEVSLAGAREAPGRPGRGRLNS